MQSRSFLQMLHEKLDIFSDNNDDVVSYLFCIHALTYTAQFILIIACSELELAWVLLCERSKIACQLPAPSWAINVACEYHY